MKEAVIQSERISAKEYVEFLTRTDLGMQYPKERFAARIQKLVKNAAISLTAREESGKIVGVLFAVTDFAYWMFVTDLGVDREWVKTGIGKRLMEKALAVAGGEKDIIVYTCANREAVGFYEKLGMKKSEDVMELNRADWTDFTVSGNELLEN